MTRPTFAHPVFEQLYARDYFIDDAVLREILALGPETAVPELLKIANSTLDTFLVDKLPDQEWSSTYYFLHALYLLNDLHAPEALDVYRRVLRLNSDSTEYWFGDMLFEELPTMMARAAQTRLPELLAMLEDPAIILQHRLVAAEALSQLSRQQPELLPAIGAFMQRHLRHIIANADQAAQLFPPDAGDYDYSVEDYLGGLLADLQNMGLRELEPEMRQLHRLGLVDGGMAGGEDDIDFDRARPLLPSPDIFTLYQQFRDVADNYSPFHPDAVGIAQRRAAEEARFAQLRRDYALQQLQRPQQPQPRQVPPKIGRNDPCSCGSGKKYKKCHGA